MPAAPTREQSLEFHKGADYAVILKPGQTTDKPLASLYGIDREVTKYGNLFAASPDGLALAYAVAEHFTGTDAPLGKWARRFIRKATGQS